MDYIILSYSNNTILVHLLSIAYRLSTVRHLVRVLLSLLALQSQPMPARAQMGSFLETTFKPNQSGKAPSFPPIRRHQFIMKVIFHHFKD